MPFSFVDLLVAGLGRLAFFLAVGFFGAGGIAIIARTISSRRLSASLIPATSLAEGIILALTPENPDSSLALSQEFNQYLGLFHGVWSSVDLTTDLAICRFLNVTPKEAHLITSGMMFGRKGRLLADLVGRSDHHKKSEILGVFNKIRGQSLRDVMAHSYMRSNNDTVTFVERSTSGEFKIKEHKFSLQEFKEHVLKISNYAATFYEVLGFSSVDIQEFADAAYNLDRKSKTSPQTPIDN